MKAPGLLSLAVTSGLLFSSGAMAQTTAQYRASDQRLFIDIEAGDSVIVDDDGAGNARVFSAIAGGFLTITDRNAPATPVASAPISTMTRIIANTQLPLTGSSETLDVRAVNQTNWPLVGLYGFWNGSTFGGLGDGNDTLYYGQIQSGGISLGPGDDNLIIDNGGTRGFSGTIYLNNGADLVNIDGALQSTSGPAATLNLGDGEGSPAGDDTVNFNIMPASGVEVFIEEADASTGDVLVYPENATRNTSVNPNEITLAGEGIIKPFSAVFETATELPVELDAFTVE